MLMDQMSAAASTPGLGERMAHRLLTRSPLGLLVRWVAGIQALRPHETSQRVPVGHTAVHCHGSAEPADDCQDVPPEPAPPPGPRAGRLVTPDRARPGHANEFYRHGAAPEGREHDRHTSCVRTTGSTIRWPDSKRPPRRRRGR